MDSLRIPVVGDIVHLKSGGAAMTVTYVETKDHPTENRKLYRVNTSWFDTNQMLQSTLNLPFEALTFQEETRGEHDTVDPAANRDEGA